MLLDDDFSFSTDEDLLELLGILLQAKKIGSSVVITTTDGCLTPSLSPAVTWVDAEGDIIEQ